MTTKTGRVLCAALTAGAALSLLNAEAITVRPSEGRIWQTCLDPSQPIRWPWVEGATSARITFASLCDNKTKVTVVEKTGAELYGTCALPAIVDGVERLYDMTLEQLSENSVVETWSARVAMLPGAFVVRDPSAADWPNSKVRRPMFAYDTAWVTGTVAAVSITCQSEGQPPTTTALTGASGYDVVVAGPGMASLAINFDDTAAFAGLCKYLQPGFLLLFR